MCTEQCGRLTAPDELELIRAFHVVARDTFAFLEPTLGFAPSITSTYSIRDGILEEVPEEDVHFPFLTCVEFAAGDDRVHVNYGDREYELSVVVTHNGDGPHRLQDWLTALGVSHELGDEYPWVQTRHGMALHARELAGALREHAAELFAADVTVTTTALTAGDKRRMRDEAHQALAAKDFERVVRLLQPIEDDLSTTDRSKLAFARKRCGG